jgi:hypothetical protein
MHQCTECGAVAAEPRLRYCEECGSRMPEYKPPPPAPEEGEPGGSGRTGTRRSIPKQSNYTGPKWLEYIPAHSPTSLGVLLHVVTLWLSIFPSLAGVGPLWSFVMIAGGTLVIAREYRVANLPNPLVDWIPQALLPDYLPVAYSALAVAMALPMLEFSLQPLLWVGGTVLVLRDQWPKVFVGRRGYAGLFEPRALLRGQRVLALAGVGACVLALFFTWTVEGEVTATTSSLGSALNAPRPISDSVYSGTGGLSVSGFALRSGNSVDIGMGATVEIGLLAFLVLLMLRPEVDRPVWLRFIPAGIVVISLAWVLVNIRAKIGPIMFLAGLVPVGIIAAVQALGRDDQDAGGYAEEPPRDEPYPEDDGPPPEEEFSDEDEPAPEEEEEDMRG